MQENTIASSHLGISDKSTHAAPSALNMANLVVLHWAIYWVMNGLDKFLNRTDISFFTWFGKDRTEQFSGYLERTDISISLLEPILYVTGVLELLVALPLLMVLTAACNQRPISRRLFEHSFFWGTLIFTGFSFFDVIFGDRAELWEHGTFFIGLLLSYKLAKEAYTENGQFE
ncbi:hypothetical protein [Epibacterium ulvae]|uniref:hypothetical protein n=1 Tax=Epibacterium ulvae TaxID=1156985 RepID=UPI002492F091|nr:hypothetical protein [Epibacterium ulvae]